MKRHRRQQIAVACASVCVLAGGNAHAVDAQTWQWKYVSRTPNSPLLAAQSTVTISPDRVRLAYTVPMQHRQLVIESCTADVRDIAGASTVDTRGTTYLLIRFKPAHGATCRSGKRPAVALPSDDARAIHNVAAAINARVATPPARTPAIVARNATPTATPLPTPSPTSAPVHLLDRVENEGVFWFIRIRNAGRTPTSISGTVFDCRRVDVGCGPFASGLVIDPGGVATVATIAATDRRAIPAFRYRYALAASPQTIVGTGSSSHLAANHVAKMSAQELRAAEADAIDALGHLVRGPARTEVPVSIVPARLIKRGSSRLAIGQTGTALIRLTIAANGTPEEATIVSINNKQLTAAAIETAVSSTYAPALQNGRAISAKYIATFSFDGEDPALAGIPMWKRSPPPTSAAGPTPTLNATPPAAPTAEPMPTPR